MDLMRRPTLLQYQKFRYLKVMLLVTAGAILIYLASSPTGGEHYGGTWLGYVLGIASAFIILWLMWYGIAKRCPPKVKDRRARHADRRKHSPQTQPEIDYVTRSIERRKTQPKNSWLHGSTLQGWLSAHIYLGTALIVLATLHTGFEFGWNVHTLAYVLMIIVIASGFFGVYAYLNYPRLITRNIGEESLESIFKKIAELDEQARIKALSFPDEINALVKKSRVETRIGGSLLQQLTGLQRHCPTSLAVINVQKLGSKSRQGDHSKQLLDLYSTLLHKEKLVAQARTEIALKARLSFWLLLHVPLSIGLLSALIAHIVAILFYW